MDPIYDDKLLNICNKLDPILKTLACFKETMERAGPSVLIDDYLDILSVFERINEAKERLGRIAEKQKQGGMAKEVVMKFSTTLTSGVPLQGIKG